MQRTTWYAGLYEKTVEDTLVKHCYYINSPDGLIAMAIGEGSGTPVIYYICKDHLGSITGIMNSSGEMLEEYNYDPWGRRRSPVDWSNSNISEPYYTNRGFTGHEHLDMFELINMNGRVYDPVISRFLSPDPFIQDPYNLLNYNRYTYCLNNPLIYTDPDGEWAITALFTLGNMWLGGAISNNFELNPAKWNWRSIGTYTSMIQGSFSGWQKGSRFESEVNSILFRKRFDRYSEMVITDINGRFEINTDYAFAEGYTASLYGISTLEFYENLGYNEPFLTGTRNWDHKNTLGKFEIRLQVYGSMYDEYNWIQTANYNETGWGFDPKDWRTRGGLYYNRSDIHLYCRYKNPDADFFFQDAPNAEKFDAQLTLCGRKGESWHAIQTFDWGYEFSEIGLENKYFNKSSQVFELHKQNINNTLRTFNFNYFIFK